jgi:hypothetical protein
VGFVPSRPTVFVSHLVRVLVHRVRAEKDAFGPGGLDLPRRPGEQTGEASIVPRVLELDDVAEIEGIEDAFGEAKPAEAPVRLLIDDAVVLDGGDPPRTADEPDDLHCPASSRASRVSTEISGTYSRIQRSLTHIITHRFPDFKRFGEEPRVSDAASIEAHRRKENLG